MHNRWSMVGAKPEDEEVSMADHSIVAVFGSMNMDLSVACERMPRAGETVDAAVLSPTPAVREPISRCRCAHGCAHVHDRRCWARYLWRCACGRAPRCRRGRESVTRLDDVETGTATIIRCESDNRIVLSPGANHALAGEDVAAH